ncbi:MAG: flagellar basal body rod protein FlgB [Limisphaerales bacterium]
MIDALFNQPAYLAAKKQLDAISLREDAISSNIANLETPGYKRIDVSPAFSTELSRACADGNAQEIEAVNPQLTVDPKATPVSPDGNTVDLDSEMLEMNKNSLANQLETQLISNGFYRMRMAITGNVT